jgi:hypothetical protein
MYLVLSAFTSSPISLVATTKASAFSFTVRTLPPNMLTSSAQNLVDIDIFYLLTATGLSPGGSTHLHTNTNNNQTTLSAVCAPSLQVLPWHLPYN